MILVSGSTGFVGEAVIRRLNASGRKVLPLSHGKAFEARADRVSLDLTNADDCEQLSGHCTGCQALIHLAGKIDIKLAPAIDGISAPRATSDRLSETYHANVVMTARLLEMALAANIRHVVFASSQSVYGLPATPVVNEDAALAPLEYYAASKAACEALLALWARGNDRKATVLRFPGVWSELRQTGTVHDLCRQALRDGRLRIGAEFPLPFDVLHCEDVATAFDAAIGRPGGGCRAYNVATGEFCSLPRLAADIAALVPGCTVESYGVPQPDIALDSRRAAAELGWSARPRRERLSSYLDQLRANRSHA